ncbi:hypothetical protein D1872_284580 [compost metagenome]
MVEAETTVGITAEMAILAILAVITVVATTAAITATEEVHQAVTIKGLCFSIALVTRTPRITQSVLNLISKTQEKQL